MVLDRLPTEHEEQREFVRWFRQVYPDVRIIAIPNGGDRSKSQGAKLKAEGVSKGVPDLFIPAWDTWIEMKRQKGGSLSPEQKDWCKYLTGLHYKCFACHGFEEAAKLISAMHQLEMKNKTTITKRTTNEREERNNGK